MADPYLYEYTVTLDPRTLRGNRFNSIGKLRFIARLFPSASQVADTLNHIANEVERDQKILQAYRDGMVTTK